MAGASPVATGSPEERRLARLHLVTDDRVLAQDGFRRSAEAVLRAGGPRMVFHLRGPRTTGAVLYHLAARLAPVAREAGAQLVVNDRVDVAIASGADGAHLGGRSLPASDARVLLGPKALLGASVRSLAEAHSVVGQGVGFVVAGTVFATASHPGRRGRGAEWLRTFADVTVPVIGIGGITPERVPDVLSAGAYGVAVLRSVWESRSPEVAIGEHLDAMGE